MDSSKNSENINPNYKSPFKKLKSPSVASPSPKRKICQRKFVVAKKKSSSSTKSVVCKCNAVSDKKQKCLCVAYENLRVSQEGFFKKEEEITECGVEKNIDPMTETLNEEGLDVGVSTMKRRRARVLETARQSIPESGRVLHLVKAFEKILTMPKSKEYVDENEKEVEEKEVNGLQNSVSSSSFCPSDLFLTYESLGLDSRRASSMDSLTTRISADSRRSRRNSAESSGTLARRRRSNRKQPTTTSPKPFKLRTEQRGQSKEEEFFKKMQLMAEEEAKQRIPIAQGLPWTTDVPERLPKPPVKEITRPIEVVLHSDVRAEERADFDHQVAEKLSYAEQWKMEREREQKEAEEEEIRRLRKELIPKAQPMPFFNRPFIPRRSEKNPTIPKEPKFHIPQHKKIKCSSSSSSVFWSDMCT